MAGLATPSSAVLLGATWSGHPASSGEIPYEPLAGARRVPVLVIVGGVGVQVVDEDMICSDVDDPAAGGAAIELLRDAHREHQALALECLSSDALSSGW